MRMIAVPVSVAQRAHQVEDLRLDRHVERGRRLVCDQEPRLARERHRDHRPLPHAAREPVRIVVEAPLGRRDAHPAQHLDRVRLRRLAADPTVAQDALDDLLADGERRVERAHRLLEDHRDPVAAQLAHRRRRQLEQIGALEPDLAAGDAARRPRHESHDRQCGDALAAAGLADDAERAARLQREAHAVDGAELAAFDVETGAEITDLEQRAHRPRAARKRSISASIAARSVTPAGRARLGRQATNGWNRSRLVSYSRPSSATGSAWSSTRRLRLG